MIKISLLVHLCGSISVYVQLTFLQSAGNREEGRRERERKKEGREQLEKKEQKLNQVFYLKRFFFYIYITV